LVELQSLVFKASQLVIMKNFPPLTFAERVFGSALTPGFGDIPVGGARRGGALILWADGAACAANNREDGDDRK
jgi:hypothetical protein